MNAQLHGHADGEALVIAGTWDPFHSGVHDTMRQLRARAEDQGRALVVVLFDPAPATFLREVPWYPFYNDRFARIELLRAAGADGVLAVDFEPEDIHGTAAEFFDIVQAHVRLGEFCLGDGQSLGRGERGSQRTIRRLGARRGFKVVVLKRTPMPVEEVLVRNALVNGSVAEAVRLVGRAPLLSQAGVAHRNQRGLPWTWHNGVYTAVPATLLNGEAHASAGQTLTFELTGTVYDKQITWAGTPPGGYVAVVAGPADPAVPAAASAFA